ncbi:hypothetical protein BV900_22015 [Agrobacterium tumefaciens]|nr:hypothetical protein BV900_22015 [Agrobacterium tumefaciens]
MFDPVWLVNIVIPALLDCTANAKGAFHPRQEQLSGAGQTCRCLKPNARRRLEFGRGYPPR